MKTKVILFNHKRKKFYKIFALLFDFLNLYNMYCFIMIVLLFVINCNITLSFPIYRCKTFCALCFIIQKLIRFELVHVNKYRVQIKLVDTMIKIIILFGKHNYIMYEPNHFLVNFPRCVFYPFGNHNR